MVELRVGDVVVPCSERRLEIIGRVKAVATETRQALVEWGHEETLHWVPLWLLSLKARPVEVGDKLIGPSARSEGQPWEVKALVDPTTVLLSNGEILCEWNIKEAVKNGFTHSNLTPIDVAEDPPSSRPETKDAAPGPARILRVGDMIRPKDDPQHRRQVAEITAVGVRIRYVRGTRSGPVPAAAITAHWCHADGADILIEENTMSDTKPARPVNVGDCVTWGTRWRAHSVQRICAEGVVVDGDLHVTWAGGSCRGGWGGAMVHTDGTPILRSTPTPTDPDPAEREITVTNAHYDGLRQRLGIAEARARNHADLAQALDDARREMADLRLERDWFRRELDRLRGKRTR